MSFDWCCRCAVPTTTTTWPPPPPPFCCFHAAYLVDLGVGGWTNVEYCPGGFSCCNAVAGVFPLETCQYQDPQHCGIDVSVPWWTYDPMGGEGQLCCGLWYLKSQTLCSVCGHMQKVQGSLQVFCRDAEEDWHFALRVTTYLGVGAWSTAMYRSAYVPNPAWYSALAGDFSSPVPLYLVGQQHRWLCLGALPGEITLIPNGAVYSGCDATTTTPEETTTTSPP